MRICNAPEATNALLRASTFISGSPSEFLHESELVLKDVRSIYAEKLTSLQIDEISGVIEQIEDAFRSVGGA